VTYNPKEAPATNHVFVLFSLINTVHSCCPKAVGVVYGETEEHLEAEVVR
jgi:hypothetical protein